MSNESYFVYILYCQITQKSYVGQTSHLILRYYEHRDGKCLWTRRLKKPVVIHWEHYPTRAEAMKEKNISKPEEVLRKKEK